MRLTAIITLFLLISITYALPGEDKEQSLVIDDIPAHMNKIVAEFNASWVKCMKDEMVVGTLPNMMEIVNNRILLPTLLAQIDDIESGHDLKACRKALKKELPIKRLSRRCKFTQSLTTDIHRLLKLYDNDRSLAKKRMSTKGIPVDFMDENYDNFKNFAIINTAIVKEDDEK